MTIKVIPPSLAAVVDTLQLNVPDSWQLQEIDGGISLILHWNEFDRTGEEYTCPTMKRCVGLKSPSTRNRDRKRLQNYRTAKGYMTMPKVSDSPYSVCHRTQESPVRPVLQPTVPSTRETSVQYSHERPTAEMGVQCIPDYTLSAFKSVASTAVQCCPETVSEFVQCAQETPSSSTQCVSSYTESEEIPFSDKVLKQTDSAKVTVDKASIPRGGKRVTEKVMKRRKCFNSEEFLVQWKDQPAKYNTWVRTIDLDHQANDYILNKGHKIRGTCSGRNDSGFSNRALSDSLLGQMNADQRRANDNEGTTSSGLDKLLPSDLVSSVEIYEHNCPLFQPSQTYDTKNGVSVTIIAENPYRATTAFNHSGTDTVASLVKDFLMYSPGQTAMQPEEVSVCMLTPKEGRRVSVHSGLRLNQLPPQPQDYPVRQHIIELHIMTK